MSTQAVRKSCREIKFTAECGLHRANYDRKYLDLRAMCDEFQIDRNFAGGISTCSGLAAKRNGASAECSVSVLRSIMRSMSGIWNSLK